ncbi:hypothetical protein HX744_11200 [Pseudonocardia sp. ICBG1122]|nr:hypothetical protein [Pseudonocardia pini]
MFDPITPAQLVGMLGSLLRESARWDRPLDEFRSSQLLSASSIARYLAAELDGAGALRARFAADADDVLAVAELAATDPGWRAELARARTRFADDTDPRDLGAAGVDVLAVARETSDPGGARFARAFRGLLAELADRHVDLLGAAGSR